MTTAFHFRRGFGPCVWTSPIPALPESLAHPQGDTPTSPAR